MEITQNLLEGLYKTWRAEFLDTFDKTETFWELVATVIQADTETEVYNWLGAVPKMREWIDERVPQGLFAHNFTIRNKDWETSIEVSRNEILYNKLKLVTNRVRELAIEAKRHPDELVFGLLRDGFVNDCYDGKKFFADNHEEGKSGVQVNYVDANSGILNLANLKKAISLMMGFKNDQGKPMGIRPDTLVVGVGDVQFTALEITQSTNIIIAAAGGGNNTLYERGNYNVIQANKFVDRVIVSEYLAPEGWVLLCTKRAVKPIIFQQFKAPEFTTLENPNQTEAVWKRKKYMYGVDAIYNAGYGLWQYAVAGKQS